MATLGKWSAVMNFDTRRWSLLATEAERDPIGWDNHNPERLTAELRLLGSDWRGHARILNAEPLQAEIWRDDE